MSELQVTTVSVNNTTNATTMVVGGVTVINSTGTTLESGNTLSTVNTSSLSVKGSDLNYTFSAEFNNSSDSFTAQGATITNFGTYIRLTSTGIDPIFRTPTFSYYGTEIGRIVVKIRRIAGSGWDGSLYYQTSGHGESGSFRMIASQPTWNGTEWAYIEYDGNNLSFGGNDFITNTITRMRFDFGGSADDIFEIDYIRFYPINNLTSNVSTKSITVGGKTFTNLYETVNVQIFTANGTWTKPVWATDGKELVVVNMWGGGGGGAYGTNISSGGGGGAFVYGYFPASQCNSVCNVVVGTAGAAGAGANATAGGDSVFWPNTTVSLSAYGGGGGQGTTTPVGGGGGGWLSAGATALGAGGGPLGGNSAIGDSTFGGGVGSVSNSTGWSSGSSVYGGGGGGTSNSTLSLNPNRSVFGGGGGGTGGISGGSSVYGGRGGGAAAAGVPGGGGGASHFSSVSTAGARGEVRIYTYRILS